ncbi:MAG: hypothetical protein HYX27_22245 [Acidobacteria bacterium]|nr:hypothetical protein [Acidobacteriota bacterium]
MWLHIAAGADAVAVLLGLYFVIDGAVSRYPADLPLALATLLLGALVGFCYYLNSRGKKWMGATLAWLPATVIISYGMMAGSWVLFY